MKLVVTSATLDADKFSQYFNSCPIFTIPGRSYPVEIFYANEPESDYLDAALTTVLQIHLSEAAGDILVFLTGKEEIDTSCEILHERMKALGPNTPELIILPVYAALPHEQSALIFEKTPVGSRKVILATNIAETSLTIDGIYYGKQSYSTILFLPNFASWIGLHQVISTLSITLKSASR